MIRGEASSGLAYRGAGVYRGRDAPLTLSWFSSLLLVERSRRWAIKALSPRLLLQFASKGYQ